MSHHLKIAPILILILLLSAGRADALSAQESGHARAGPATDEPFTTSDVELHTKSLAHTIPCESFDDDFPYPLAYEKTLDLAIQAVHIGR